jgi:hypothetical protein
MTPWPAMPTTDVNPAHPTPCRDDMRPVRPRRGWLRRRSR